MLSEKIIILFMKLSFSAVILQLLYISICLTAYIDGTADASYPLLLSIPEMLEYAAASTVLTIGGGLLLEYVRKTEGL